MIEYKVVSWDEASIPLHLFNDLGADNWVYTDNFQMSGWTHYLFTRFHTALHPLTPGEALDAELPFDLVVTDVSEETAAD